MLIVLAAAEMFEVASSITSRTVLSSVVQTPGLTCTSPDGWQDTAVPAGILLNGSSLQCIEECAGSDPLLKNKCSMGLRIPFCVRGPLTTVIGGQTEAEYLQTHLFGQGRRWADDACGGACSPAPKLTLYACDAGRSPFVYNSLLSQWQPDCEDGVCQLPSYEQDDGSLLLCTQDIRMSQCGQEENGALYAFIRDGDTCDADAQCYHGSTRDGWRPFPSACVEHVCMPSRAVFDAPPGRPRVPRRAIYQSPSAQPEVDQPQWHETFFLPEDFSSSR